MNCFNWCGKSEENKSSGPWCVFGTSGIWFGVGKIVGEGSGYVKIIDIKDPSKMEHIWQDVYCQIRRFDTIEESEKFISDNS